MKIKFVAVFAVLAAFATLTLTGCATYWAGGVMPILGDLSSMDKVKLSTKIGDGIVVTAYPLTTKAEAKRYFDEDLIGKGILPIFIEIQNKGVTTVELVAVTLNNGGTIPAMSPGDLYGVIKRDWGGRAIFWMFPTYFVGAPVSAFATYITNQKIRQDLEGTEDSKGKLLKFGKVGKGTTTGFVCFKGSTSLPKGKLKLIFQNNEGLLECNLDIKG